MVTVSAVATDLFLGGWHGPFLPESLGWIWFLLKVAALLGPVGANAPRKTAIVVPPRVDENLVAVIVSAGIGDYRAGDEIWCETLGPDDYARALNRDVLVPRPAGRFLFGRLINRVDEKLQILPLEAGGRQQVVANPPWLGMAVKLVRSL